MARNFESQDAIRQRRAAATGAPISRRESSEGVDRFVPDELRGWLASLRLLHGVPFAYLVPDAQLLPPESIRFFYLDRGWTDAAVQGAMSVGTVSSEDRAQLDLLYPSISSELDEQERWLGRREGEARPQGRANVISGFLLRSRAVSGWPGLHVRAYKREVGEDDEIHHDTHPDRVMTLRLERLAPAVLLALFDGIPRVVHIEEPRQGVQFGVYLNRAASGNISAEVPARDVRTAEALEGPAARRLGVAFRKGAPGVLDLRATRDQFLSVSGANMHDPTSPDGAELASAEFALQMIRYPYRQVFGELSGEPARMESVFRPQVGQQIDDLRARIRRVVS